MKSGLSHSSVGTIRPWACVSLALLGHTLAWAGQLASGTFKPDIDELKGQTLFAFDNVSIPFTRSLKVEMHAPEKYSGNPVLGRGKSGEPDSWAIHFYGSVIRDNGKFRMWYIGTGDERGQTAEHNTSFWRLLYAESDDGVKWVRPKLGLVEYRGSKQNNLLLTQPFMGAINVKVILDADDPDPVSYTHLTLPTNREV